MVHKRWHLFIHDILFPTEFQSCGILCFPLTTLSPLLPTYFISSPKQSNAEEINSTHNASPSRARMERAMWG